MAAIKASKSTPRGIVALLKHAIVGNSPWFKRGECHFCSTFHIFVLIFSFFVKIEHFYAFGYPIALIAVVLLRLDNNQ
jgi:hypothetical protein